MRPARGCLIRRAMTKRSAGSLLLLVTLIGACGAARPQGASQLEWQKSSDFAPSLKDARENCKGQTAAEKLELRQGNAFAVGGNFVNCMRAAGWTLLDHGTE